jgi:hypothetical protein
MTRAQGHGLQIGDAHLQKETGAPAKQSTASTRRFHFPAVFVTLTSAQFMMCIRMAYAFSCNCCCGECSMYIKMKCVNVGDDFMTP